MFCSICRVENAEESRFCTNCGAKMKRVRKQARSPRQSPRSNTDAHVDMVDSEYSDEPVDTEHAGPARVHRDKKNKVDRGRRNDSPGLFDWLKGGAGSSQDLSSGQHVIIAARWVLVVAGLTLALIHPDPEAIGDLRVIIVVLLGLAGANFYLHTQLLTNRPALAGVVYGASAADLIAVSLIVLAQGGFDSQVYVFYFPAMLAFSVAFGTQMTLVFAGGAIATYGLIASSTFSGDDPEVIVVRLLMLGAVAFCGMMYWRIERDRRNTAEQLREALKSEVRQQA